MITYILRPSCFHEIWAISVKILTTFLVPLYGKNTQSWIEFLKLNLENRIFLMLKSFIFILLKFVMLNSSLSAHMFIYFRLCERGANLLPLIVLHLCCFFNSLFLLWLIRDGWTFYFIDRNLLKIKKIACFFYIMKNIHGRVTAPPRPPAEKLMHENFAHAYITMVNSIL